jgi:hypothetical protein
MVTCAVCPSLLGVRVHAISPTIPVCQEIVLPLNVTGRVPPPKLWLSSTEVAVALTVRVVGV